MTALRLTALVLVLGAIGAGPDARADGTSAAPAVDRRVGDRRIAEASGLAVSPRHAGVLWTHEDSGRPARLYAIARDGATVATITLRGTEAIDWEAMAVVRDRDRQPALAVADIGDNNARRAQVTIAVAREPKSLRDARLKPLRQVRLRYPGGAVDAEALLAHPRTGQLYIVTKNLLGAELYAVPPAAWPGGGDGSLTANAWDLQRVAQVEMPMVTDGAFLPDGRMLLRSYASMSVFPPPPAAPTAQQSAGGAGATVPTLRPVASMNLPSQKQGESLALTPDGRAVLLGSEGVRQPVLRVAVPTAAATPAASAGPTGAATPGTTSDRAGEASEKGGAGDGLPPFTGPVLLGSLALLILVSLVVMLALR